MCGRGGGLAARRSEPEVGRRDRLFGGAAVESEPRSLCSRGAAGLEVERPGRLRGGSGAEVERPARSCGVADDARRRGRKDSPVARRIRWKGERRQNGSSGARPSSGG